MILPILLFLLAFLNQTPSSNASSRSNDVSAFSHFSFPTFTTTSCDDGALICMGSVTSKDGYLSLTPEPEDDSETLNQVSRVLFKHPVFAWPATITTTFTINMNTFPGSNNPADGITFIMAPDSNPPPVNSHGGYLGLMNSTLDGNVVGQLAVELDTFKNTYDIDNNHVGIDTTSITSPLVAKSLSAKLSSGNDIKVRIDYSPIGEILQVSMAPVNEEMTIVLSQSIKLSDTVPKSIYVGFTASTGEYRGTHRILDWEFTSVDSLETTDATNVGRGIWNIMNKA
ncbi:putative Concanavalin A-like lectin protein kinase family protein [Tripterygium wilfordii]|uniref:Putative Concanavalin A-like lectin protein kinase family protein n=1 Tax=Tripterygium wilfordii TaxID=458696 RepID=A0A7J7CFR6_TRIWF|nr:seed lectin subunit I-like [Tripterygium wilfordii]KAF5733028.1 putative Concanavalin A-like lectin protein kinase family protein [Tripterygium wilfordii]KAF5733034.1 putative Concanavalin A-like lectin protein kinase family protein [Tripterygium wilfordii]